jgi:hypothetical protein
MRRLAVVLAASVFGLLGCRDPTVSRSAFLTRGNDVCAAAVRRIAGLAVPRVAPDAAPERFAGYVDDYVAELRLELINLRAVGYPPGQRARLEADYHGMDMLLAAAERDPVAFSPRIFLPAELALGGAGLSACRP